MSDEVDQFLEAIYGDSQGYVPIVILDEERQPSDQTWLHWPTKRDAMLRYIDLHLEEDVYTSAALYSERERSKDDEDAVSRTVYADADAVHPSKFRVRPSISVQTSAGRWHCWWVLDSEVSADDAAKASQKIAKAHGLEASSGIKTKILRIPGTTNTKHGKETVTAKYTGEIYSLSEISKVYQDIDLAAEVKKAKDEGTPAFLDIDVLESELIHHTNIGDLYSQAVPAGSSWSERLYRLEIDLFRANFTAPEVFTIAWNARCNKYHPDHAGMLTESGVPIPRRSNPEDVLWAEVLKAQGEYKIETMAVVADREPVLDASMNFVTPEERALVEDYRTYIDDFDDWVASRSPQSDVRYRRSAGYMVLSCIFGDKIFLAQKHANVAPNMWLLTLGPTSIGKKTTVHDRAMDVIRAWETLTGREIIIANTFSEEAMNSTLGPRDGQVSLWAKDEIQGFFKAILAKGYMASIKDYLTELFNGRVLISLRQNKDAAQKKRASTVFNIYGLGTPDQTASALTIEDFASGFMMRFVYALGEDREVDIEDLLSSTYTGDDAMGIDPEPKRAAQHFQKIMRKFTKPQTMMKVEGENLERVHQWERMVYASVLGKKDQRLLIAGINRLSIQLQKCMILLAASEGRTEVNMMDVIQVLRQGEWWFQDFLEMLKSVGESEFQTQANEIFRYVDRGKNSTRNLANTKREFGRYKPRQFDEFVESLVQQGLVELVRDKTITYIKTIR